jgi:hypothetical protein
MTPTALRPAAEMIGPGLLTVAALNGWAPRLLAENAPAVSLFAPVALAVALAAAPMRPVEGGGRGRAMAVTLAVALILTPSGVAAWLALGLLALTLLAPGAPRTLALALAAAELFAAVGLNQVKAALLPLEAGASGALLSIAGVPAEVQGNVIAVADRLTVVAAGCSGAPGALFAGLGASALLTWRRPGAGLRLCLVAALLAGVVSFAVNLARLSVMAVDARLYEAAHGQWGAFATDLLASAGVVGAVLLAERIGR